MGEGSSEHRSHRHRHSKHHSKKHSKHSHSKHKHRHHHNHHHHRKKHHKHHSKTKAELDERLIQNALESIEVDVLEAIRVPEALDRLIETTSQCDDNHSGSEDSDTSSSDSEKEQADKASSSKKVSSKIGVSAGDTATAAQDNGSGLTDGGVVLEEETPDSDKYITDALSSDKATLPQNGEIGSDTKTAAVVKVADKGASGEGAGDVSSEDEDIFIASSTLKSSKKVIKVNIKSQLGDNSNKSTPNVLDDGAESSSNNSTREENKEQELKSPNTVTVVSSGAKVRYVNLKPSQTESSKSSEKDKIQDSDVFGTITKTETIGQEKEENTASSVVTKKGKRPKKLSRSNSRSRSRSLTPSKSRRRSRRSHSKSHRKSRHHRSRSRSHSHSRRHITRRSRSRSRSNSRSPSSYRHNRQSTYRGHRGRSRSRSRSHSRSRRVTRRSSRLDHDFRRRRSPQRYRSRRSSSRSPRRRRRSPRSRSRSRSKSRSKSKSKSRSRSRSPSNNHTSTTPTPSADPKEVVQSISVIASGIVSKAKQTKISELTAFCEGLQKKQAVENEFGPPSEGEETNKEEEASFRTPFNVQPTPVYQPGLVFHNNAWKTANQVLLETATEVQQRPLEEKFPVSTGMEHSRHKEEMGGAQVASDSINIFAKFQPVSMGDLVVKRLEATRQLQLNPNDFSAQQTIAYIEQQTAMWAESQLKPGQFTGQQKIVPLTRELHKEGKQAWAKKNMFRDLAPVMSGFGMKMLKKMGWEEGKPLGRMGEGHVTPIEIDVKLNRSGLSTEMDKKQHAIVPATALQATGKANHLVDGKNPISALQEICAKKRWITPQYNLVMSGGPPHMMTFLFQVTIPIGTFQPSTASNNKKQAKAQAAMAALQGLGFMPKTIEYSASYS